MRNILFVLVIVFNLLSTAFNVGFCTEGRQDVMSLPEQGNMSDSDIQMVTNETTGENFVEDELSGINDSDITTKIYRSTDPAAKLLENKYLNKDSLEGDILNKDDLLNKSKKHKVKLDRRKNNEDDKVKISRSNLLLPWIVLLVTCIILGIIFRLINQKKL